MSDRMRFRIAVLRYRVRYDARGTLYGFTHPGAAIRAHLRDLRAR